MKLETASRTELLAELTAVEKELTRALATRHMAPFLDLDITAQQLKTVFLVSTGTVATVTQVAEHLGISVPTASASADKLVELGLLTRSEDHSDRRIKRLAATRKARRLHDRFLGVGAGTQEVSPHLTDDELRGLLVGFSGVRRVLAAFQQEAGDAETGSRAPQAENARQ